MRTGPLFFDPTLDPGELAAGEVRVLAGPEGHHAASVRRLRAGEHILVGDGAGEAIEAVVRRVDKRQVEYEVTGRDRDEAPSVRLTLAQALAKGGRDELAIQVATESGVDAVVPWQAERSVSRWDERKRVTGVERWGTIVREAAKQSLRLTVPGVLDPVATREPDGLARLVAGHDLSLLLDPYTDARLSRIELPRGVGSILLLVGPEGGVDDAEREALHAAGVRSVLLGDTVLRTSSAGPAAIAVLNARLGRW